MNEPDYSHEIVPATAAPSKAGWLVPIVLALLIATFVGLRMWVEPAVSSSSVAAVRFEMRLAERNPGPGLTEAIVRGAPSSKVYLHPEPVLANEHLESAQVGEANGQPTVEFETNATGAILLRQATAANKGKLLAILVDGEVCMAPVINARIGGRGVLQGSFSPIEAERIAQGILAR